MPNDEARKNDETYSADLLRLSPFGITSSLDIRASSLCLRVDYSHAGRVSFNRGATCWATAKSPCSEIRSDHEKGCDQLCHKRFDCWKNGEPESHPSRDVCFKKRDRCSGNPLRELHFLGLLADHHEQHDSQQNA